MLPIGSVGSATTPSLTHQLGAVKLVLGSIYALVRGRDACAVLPYPQRRTIAR